MIERPLMTPDELKSMPKGQFVVMKTGTYPMKVRLKLFFKWGIQFLEPYRTEERAGRKVAYASREKLIESVRRAYSDTPETGPVDHDKPAVHDRPHMRADHAEDAVPEENKLYLSEASDRRKVSERQDSGQPELGKGFRLDTDASSERKPLPVDALPSDIIPSAASVPFSDGAEVSSSEDENAVDDK